MAQCFPDRHNSSPDAMWVSCETSTSPNAARGDSHWILYDLGEDKKLGQIHLWNINHPDGLESGAKQIVIDYSDDGVLWEEWGSYDIDMAQGSGFYEGAAGPDLDGLQTSHLLLTITENHGGPCAGFAEIRIETSEISSVSDVEPADFSLYPNPATEYTMVRLHTDSYEQGQIILLDETGRSLMTQDVSWTGGSQETKVNFPADVPAGQYIMRLVTDKRDSAQDFSIISN